MGLRKRFWEDRRGTTFEGIALSVSIVAVAFVASADMLDYLTKARQPVPVASVDAALHQTPPVMAAMSRDNGLDYEPTGSLPKLISRSVLDPCTGAIK